MFFYRLNYLFFSILLALFLSLRAIPAVDDANDLGRYLEYLSEFCSQGSYEGLSYLIFLNFYSASCWTDSQWIFIFSTALTIPLGMIFYVRDKISMLVGISALLSVASLELMTNALRQGLAFLFFAYAIFMFGQIKKSYFLMIFSIASHSSLFFYSPVIFFFKKINNIFIKIFMVILILVSICLFSEGAQFYLGEYMEIYSEKPNAPYVVFLLIGYLIAPLSLIFNLGELKKYIGSKVFFYNSFLMIASYLLFPYIFYRFAVFSTLINYILLFDKLFIIKRLNFKAVVLLMLMTVAHTSTMIYFSKSFLHGVFL